MKGFPIKKETWILHFLGNIQCISAFLVRIFKWGKIMEKGRAATLSLTLKIIINISRVLLHFYNKLSNELRTITLEIFWKRKYENKRETVCLSKWSANLTNTVLCGADIVYLFNYYVSARSSLLSPVDKTATLILTVTEKSLCWTEIN